MDTSQSGPRAHHRGRTVRINERVCIIGTRMVSFYLYSDAGCTICFDSGSSVERAARGLAVVGLEPAQVSHVFLTHADSDHVGGVAAFDTADVYLPQAEEAIASGVVPRRIFLFRLRGSFRHPYNILAEGESIRVGSTTIRPIATPGHTPGSTCYLINDEMLVTGDLLMLRRGRCRPMPRLLCNDPTENERSLRKLAQQVRSVNVLCTAHSGYTTDYEYAMTKYR